MNKTRSNRARKPKVTPTPILIESRDSQYFPTYPTQIHLSNVSPLGFLQSWLLSHPLIKHDGSQYLVTFQDAVAWSLFSKQIASAFPSWIGRSFWKI